MLIGTACWGHWEGKSDKSGQSNQEPGILNQLYGWIYSGYLGRTTKGLIRKGDLTETVLQLQVMQQWSEACSCLPHSFGTMTQGAPSSSVLMQAKFS